MANIVGPNIVTNSLIALFDAANIKSYPGTGTTCFDIASTNSGTFNSGPTFNSGNAGYFGFDGTDDWITLNSSISSSTTRTISVWYQKTYTVDSGIGYLFSSQGSGESPNKGIAREEGTTTRRFYYFNGASVTYITTNDSVDTFTNTTSTWQNLVFIENTSTNTLSFYTQGAFVRNVSITGLGFSIRTVGKGFTGGGLHPLLGNIAQFMVYDRTLSAQEIQQNYNALKSRFGY